MRIKAPTHLDSDRVRSGSRALTVPSCAADDDAFIWVDDHWRLSARSEPPSVPVLVDSRDEGRTSISTALTPAAAELGPMIVRLDE